MIGKLDTLLGYAGIRAFRKTWLDHFRATDQLLENGKAVSKEQDGLVKRSAPAEWLLNYELGSDWRAALRVFGQGRTRSRVSFGLMRPRLCGNR